jgi:hypothetical protein
LLWACTFAVVMSKLPVFDQVSRSGEGCTQRVVLAVAELAAMDLQPSSTQFRMLRGPPPSGLHHMAGNGVRIC